MIWKKNKKIILGLAFLFVLGIIFWGVREGLFNNQKIKEVNKEIKKEISRTELKIGYITDVHCFAKQDKKTQEWNLNWRCVEPMNNFISHINNEWHPELAIEGGDFVDGRDRREEASFIELKEIYDQLTIPHYHVLGNHETRGFSKQRWLELTNNEKTYYHFDIREYRIIVLDANFKPIENGEIDTSPDIKYYPGYINQEQMLWLENLLKQSDDYVKLIFIHQPPVESTTLKPPMLLFTNGEQLRNIFSQYKVKAVFSGHIEEQCYLEKDGVKYYVLEGVHKSNRQLPEDTDFKDQGVFYDILLNKEKDVEVKMYYKNREDLEYKTLIIDDTTSTCNNNSVLKPEEYNKIPVVLEEETDKSLEKDENQIE